MGKKAIVAIIVAIIVITSMMGNDAYANDISVPILVTADCIAQDPNNRTWRCNMILCHLNEYQYLPDLSVCAVTLLATVPLTHSLAGDCQGDDSAFCDQIICHDADDFLQCVEDRLYEGESTSGFVFSSVTGLSLLGLSFVSISIVVVFVFTGFVFYRKKKSKKDD